MLTAKDITGIMALPPTPVREGVDFLGPESTIDLDESTRAANQLVVDGVGSIAMCGTTGECATLTWPERQELYAAVRETIAGRVPLFAGTTALGTREVVQQMRIIRDLGVDAAFVGLPLWQTPTLENAVGFYAGLAEAVPDLPVIIYGNRFFFKFQYPLEFWEQIAAKAPTVVATKVGFEYNEAVFKAAGHQVNFIHGEAFVGDWWRQLPESVTAAWATSTAMGPEPWVAFFKALDAGDTEECERILKDVKTVPSMFPDMSKFPEFPSYNIQAEKLRINAAGYMHCGPPRPPYTDLPDDWRASCEANGRGWAELAARYRSA